jgi:DNA-binding NarL/FixJ family response regulator
MDEIVTHATGPLVLIVDDVPDNLSVLSDTLDEAGFTVLVATDGERALAQARLAPPDIVLLDAVMPGLDGFETCRRLKAGEDTADIPVVFMTGLAEPEHVIRGLQAGGVDYVTKPLDPDVVVARVRAPLRTAHHLRQARAAVDEAALAIVVIEAGGGGAVWASGRARELAARYFDAGDADPAVAVAGTGSPIAIPERLIAWVRAHDAAAIGDESLLVERPHGSLTVRLVGRHASGNLIVHLGERARDPTEPPSAARRYALTQREMEVLSWVGKGKTNRDVADILGISPRTVNKHLENVFEKLGVETRAAAAAIWTGVLQHAGVVGR